MFKNKLLNFRHHHHLNEAKTVSEAMSEPCPVDIQGVVLAAAEQLDAPEHLAIIDIPDVLGITEATHLKEDLIDKLQTFKEIHVPLDHVTKVSTTFLQTMIVASKHAKANGVSLKWKSPSKVVVDSFSDLGLYGQLMSMEFA